MMKHWLVGMSLLLGIVLLLGASYAAFSQDPQGGPPQGGGMQGMPPGGMRGGMMQRGMPPMNQMKAGAQGLFLLQGTKLLKFSATLQAQGTVDLTEAKTTGRQLPGAFMLAGDDVLIVTGTTFYRVDGKTMKVAVKKALPTTTTQAGNGRTTTGQADNEQPGNGPAANGQQPQQMQPPPAALELNNRTLYLMSGTSLLAISIDDGSVLGQATLQKPTANAGAMDAPPMDAPPAPPQ